MKINSYFENFKSLANSYVFKIYVSIMFVVALFCTIYTTYQYGHQPEEYLISIIHIFSYSYYYIILISSLLLVTFQTIKLFKCNYGFLIRLKNKKNHFSVLLKQIFFNCAMCFLVQFIFILIGLNIFHSSDFGLYFTDYGVNTLIYSIFLVLRSFVYIMFLMGINGLLLYVIDSKIVIGLDIIFLTTMVNYYGYCPTISTESFGVMPIIISGFFGETYFSNFSIELVYSVGYFLVMLICLVMIFKYIVNFNNSILSD